MVWGCPTPRKTAWAGKWGLVEFHGHNYYFEIFRGLMKKKQDFLCPKKWVPEYFTVGFLYNGCLLGLTTFFPVRVACAICSPFMSTLSIWRRLIYTGSFRFLCAPKLRWWRHHYWNSTRPKSIATSGVFFENLSWQFEVGESSCPSKKWSFWNWLVNCG